MSNDEAQRSRLGLCADCRHHRVQTSRRGSDFHRCERSEREPAFPRYPPLPVRRCPGHEADGAAGPGGPDDGGVRPGGRNPG